MQLLLDIGNTRIKWAFASGKGLLGAGEFVHCGCSPVEALAFIDQFKHDPVAAAMVNVAGTQLSDAIAVELDQRFNCPLQVVQVGEFFGSVRNGYVAAEQLGADRWAALVGAWHIERDAVCVVDAGSALTIDLVASDGQHYGGTIVPGISLMCSTLLSETSDIAGFAERGTAGANADDWFGRDTASAIDRGSLMAAVSMVEAAVTNFPQAQTVPKLFVTGGDASVLQQLLKIDSHYRPHLVLEGLQYLIEDID